MYPQLLTVISRSEFDKVAILTGRPLPVDHLNLPQRCQILPLHFALVFCFGTSFSGLALDLEFGLFFEFWPILSCLALSAKLATLPCHDSERRS